MIRSTHLAAGATLAALFVLLASAGVGLADVEADHDVDIEVPDDFAEGEREIQIVIENHDDDADLFAPIIEIPLGSAVDASDPNPSATYGDVTLTDRPWAILESSYQSGDSLYVYGDEVPAGETKSYTVTIDVKHSGEFTLEADVRPMYDEQANARATATVSADGSGELDVSVLDADGSPIEDANVTVGDELHEGVSDGLTVALAEGEYEVAVDVGGTAFPGVAATVESAETTTVTFVATDSQDPRVVATVGDAAVVEDSAFRTETRAATAVEGSLFEVSASVDTNGGPTVVGVDAPEEIPAAFNDVTATVDGTAAAVETAAGTYVVVLESDGVSLVEFEFDGFPRGDATGTGAVTTDDAQQIALALASGDDVSPTADVTGTGEVTAVDAMMIAQYADGNRDAEFRRAD